MLGVLGLDPEDRNSAGLVSIQNCVCHLHQPVLLESSPLIVLQTGKDFETFQLQMFTLGRDVGGGSPLGLARRAG